MEIVGIFMGWGGETEIFPERLFHSKWPNLLNQSEATGVAITYLVSRSGVRGPDSSLTTSLIAM